jgi:hypothetical protein
VRPNRPSSIVLEFHQSGIGMLTVNISILVQAGNELGGCEASDDIGEEDEGVGEF